MWTPEPAVSRTAITTGMENGSAWVAGSRDVIQMRPMPLDRAVNVLLSSSNAAMSTNPSGPSISSLRGARYHRFAVRIEGQNSQIVQRERIAHRQFHDRRRCFQAADSHAQRATEGRLAAKCQFDGAAVKAGGECIGQRCPEHGNGRPGRAALRDHPSLGSDLPRLFPIESGIQRIDSDDGIEPRGKRWRVVLAECGNLRDLCSEWFKQIRCL